MSKFSIVVPVYNVEKYLEECIDSILDQSYDDYELILVNDGSTDNSGLICEEKASNSNNIFVIHKENGGLSDARNVGMRKSKGKYIFFIDSDDFIEPDTLSKFNDDLERYNNPDVLITRMKKVYDKSEIILTDENMPADFFNNNLEKDSIIKWIFTKSNNTWPAQRYIVKREFIVKYNMEFAFGYLHEDVDWTTNLFVNGRTFRCSNYYGYNHRMSREGSITNSRNGKRTIDVIELVSKNLDNMQLLELNEDSRNSISNRLILSLYGSLRHYNFASKEHKNKILYLLRINSGKIKNTPFIRHKVFYCVSKVLGFKVGLKIMNAIHK